MSKRLNAVPPDYFKADHPLDIEKEIERLIEHYSNRGNIQRSAVLKTIYDLIKKEGPVLLIKEIKNAVKEAGVKASHAMLQSVRSELGYSTVLWNGHYYWVQ